jgi:hypothetical protein
MLNTMDETKVIPTTDAIVEPVEGSVASIDTPVETKEEMVPLSALLDVKSDMKKLKHELKEAKTVQTQSEQSAYSKSMVEKYPDVDPEFIAGILASAVAEAKAELAPQFEKVENDRKQVAFDSKFDTIFAKAVSDNPNAKNVDKDVIKALALTPQYNNMPLADIIAKLYNPVAVGKSASENDMRAVPDIAMENIDIGNITPEQKRQILDNPKTRQQYYDKLDALGK